MKKNFRILCAMGLVSSALLVACGNTSKVSETTKVVESSSEEAATEKTSEKQSKAYPFTIDSDTGNENVSVTFEEAPKKSVSLSGFTTEMLLSLGLEDSMVGYGYQDNEVLPEYKDALSKVEELSKTNPTKEVLLSKEPDFLTGWKSTFSDKNFDPKFNEENGIKIYVPRSEYTNAKMENVYEDYANFGKIFNVSDKADEIVSKMKSDIATVNEKIKDLDKVSVFVYDSGEKEAFTASAGLTTDIISLAGGENVFAGEEKNWMSVSFEDVVSKNPDYIIVMDYKDSDPLEQKLNFLKTHPALKELDAVKNDRIFTLGLSDVLAGPRNVAAIEKIARELHPEAFK